MFPQGDWSLSTWIAFYDTEWRFLVPHKGQQSQSPLMLKLKLSPRRPLAHGKLTFSGKSQRLGSVPLDSPLFPPQPRSTRPKERRNPISNHASSSRSDNLTRLFQWLSSNASAIVAVKSYSSSWHRPGYIRPSWRSLRARLQHAFESCERNIIETQHANPVNCQFVVC